MFVTLVCGVFTPGTGGLSLANAGQCRPLLLRANEPSKWIFDKLGTALGLEPGLQFERTDIRLKNGDALVLYSDGVSEAFNSQQQCYGVDHLLADLDHSGGQPASLIAERLLEKVRDFAGEAPQSDDIAILVFKTRRGQVNDRGGENP